MPRHLWRSCCLVAAVGCALARPAAQTPVPPSEMSTATIEITALDRAGAVSADLRSTDLTVSIDGKPRPVLWTRRVSRGPGAMADATARQARSSGPVAFLAEPGRTVLLVVDAASFVRGNERPALRVAQAFLDRLGMSDKVGVVQIPLSSDGQMPLTADKSVVREALGRVAGTAPREIVVTEAAADVMRAGEDLTGNPTRERAFEVDPTRERAGETDRTVVDGGRSRDSRSAVPGAGTDLEHPLGRDSASGVLSLLRALQAIPGRKVVALVSAGFAVSSAGQVEEAAAAAVAARAVVYGFGLSDPAGTREKALDAGLLDRLARATGGTFVIPGNKPDQVMARVMTELSACYVVGVQAGSDDGGNRQRALRVETSRRDLTLRVPSSWFAGSPVVEDLEPDTVMDDRAADTARAQPGSVDYRGGGRAISTPEPPLPSPRDAELGLALGRLYDYVEAYERQYSALVAEEDFRQVLSRRSLRLRSDFLLVKPEGSDEWMSFRDVFEVDGVPVPDREDRLKRLFLNPGPVTQAQLDAIRDESARHNIGPFERTINVPLLPLRFLSEQNRVRFRFKVTGDKDVDGVRTWRVEYKEVVGPTMITDRANNDLFAQGWFLVDQITGAVVESGVKVDQGTYQAAVVVKFRRDDKLGMWVPAEMKETYKMPRARGGVQGVTFETVLDGVAKYSKFRRFQVKTEETVTVPK